MHLFCFATELNIFALTLHKVFSSLLLLKPANFLDIRWQPLSLQTPALCWSAYPVLLSHLEFPTKKTKTDNSITDCTSVLCWNSWLLKRGAPGMHFACSLILVHPLAHLCRSPVVHSSGTSAGRLWKAHWFRQQQKELLVPSCHAFM